MKTANYRAAGRKDVFQWMNGHNVRSGVFAHRQAFTLIELLVVDPVASTGCGRGLIEPEKTFSAANNEDMFLGRGISHLKMEHTVTKRKFKPVMCSLLSRTIATNGNPFSVTCPACRI